jgi:hypothetical protein
MFEKRTGLDDRFFRKLVYFVLEIYKKVMRQNDTSQKGTCHKMVLVASVMDPHSFFADPHSFFLLIRI